MSTLTIELTPDLAERLEAAAGSAPEAQAALATQALEAYPDERRRRIAERVARAYEPFPDGQSFFDVARHLVGKYEGPGDLSTNPKYMEGFGDDGNPVRPRPANSEKSTDTEDFHP